MRITQFAGAVMKTRRRSMSMNEIIYLYHQVWSFRHRNENHWPTPGELDSLRFAFTEIAEAIDAELRVCKKYKRNDDRNQDTDSELADCAIMLLTSLGEDYHEFKEWEDPWIDPAHTIEEIAECVGDQLLRSSRFEDNRNFGWEYKTLRALVGINEMVDDLGKIVELRLLRIFHKHVRPKLEGV
jgi:hypothetical protein